MSAPIQRKPEAVHPWVGRTSGRWWAVITKHGHVSEAHAIRHTAEGNMLARGDAAECSIAEVEIIIKSIEPRGKK